MKTNKNVKKAGVLVAILSIVLLGTLGISLLDLSEPVSAKPELPEDHLFIDATFLLKTDETNESVFINVDLYLTNIWDIASGEIKATAYVIETDNNFAVNKSTVEIGKIKAKSTSEIGIPVKLSNNSYKVEILLFEDGLLVLKGELTISAHPLYSWEEIEHESGLEQVWILKNSKADFIRVRD